MIKKGKEVDKTIRENQQNNRAKALAKIEQKKKKKAKVAVSATCLALQPAITGPRVTSPYNQR